MAKVTTERGRGLSRERNPNWKGGRVVDPRGYILIRVGVGHHLADTRGYAYEHRIVAEKKLGRRLRKGEIPHHKDENKSNNDPSNIEVLPSIAEHRFAHRSREKGLRRPGQSNPYVTCKCGCRISFRKYDESGRPRRFVPGHNPHPSPTVDVIVAALKNCPLARYRIAEIVRKPLQTVAVALSQMKRAGLVSQRMRGIWQLKAT